MDEMSGLTFSETYGFCTVELCEDNKQNLTLGWISREPNSRTVFQQAMDVDEISFDHIAAIYAKMIEVEVGGVADDHESEIERLQAELVSRDALIKKLSDALVELMDGFDIVDDAKLDSLLAEYRASKDGGGK